MSEKTWQGINNLKPDLQPPNKILNQLSDGLHDATGGLVDYEIDKVNFFPEEVTYTTKTQDPFSSLSQFGTKKVKNPHPEFGYDTSEGKNVEFRFRYILKVADQPSIKAEIFKFKYPVTFYPVKYFTPKSNFEDLEEFYDKDDNLIAENEDLFKKICLIIFQSDEFTRLIKRFSAMGT